MNNYCIDLFETSFIYKGKQVLTSATQMQIAIFLDHDFYRVTGSHRNIDFFQVKGVWYTLGESGLSPFMIAIIGNAITAGQYGPRKAPKICAGK